MKLFRRLPFKASALCSGTVLAVLVGALALWSKGYFLSAQTGKETSSRSANSTVQERLVYYNNVGIALLEQFNFQEAIAQFDQCRKLDPYFVPAFVNSGLARYYLQEYPEAEELIKKALVLDPKQPTALFTLGMLYRIRDEIDPALQMFQKVLETDPEDSPTLYQVGQLLYKSRNYDQAERYFRKVIQISPYDTAAHYNLATTLSRKGNIEEGRKAMLDFNRLRENGGMSSTGNQYGEQGRYMLAIGEYSDLKARIPIPRPATSLLKPIRFVDGTASAGVRFQHGARVETDALSDPVPSSAFSAAFARRNLVSAMGSGAAFCDYDNDGNLDLMMANSSDDPSLSAARLYHNNGKGQFEDVTERAGIRASGLGMGAYWGDFNNDGFADLFLTFYGSNLLYQNNGNGTFSDVTARAGVGGGDHWHLSAAVADYDHDGDLDIYVGNYADLNQKPASQSFRFPDDFSGQKFVISSATTVTGHSPMLRRMPE